MYMLKVMLRKYVKKQDAHIIGKIKNEMPKHNRFPNQGLWIKSKGLT